MKTEETVHLNYSDQLFLGNCLISNSKELFGYLIETIQWKPWSLIDFELNGYLSSSLSGGARGVMVIVTGYGHGDTSSIPGQDW